MDDAEQLGREIAEKLLDAASGYSGKRFSKGFIEAFFAKHPTLQQAAATVMVQVINEAASRHNLGFGDGRTEAFYSFAAKVKETCPNSMQGFPYI